MMGTSVFPNMLENAQGTLLPHTLVTGLLFTSCHQILATNHFSVFIKKTLIWDLYDPSLSLNILMC